MYKAHYKNLLANNVWLKNIKGIARSKVAMVAAAQLSILGDKALSIASQNYLFKAIGVLCVKLPFSQLILPALALGWVLKESFEFIKPPADSSPYDAALREAYISVAREWPLKNLIYSPLWPFLVA